MAQNEPVAPASYAYTSPQTTIQESERDNGRGEKKGRVREIEYVRGREEERKREGREKGGALRH